MSQTDSKQARAACRASCSVSARSGVAAGGARAVAAVQREGSDGRDEQHEQPHRKGEIQAADALFGFGAATVDRREHGALILRVEAEGAEALVDGFADGRVFFHRTQPLSSR